jgi:hypothetical protein
LAVILPSDIQNAAAEANGDRYLFEDLLTPDSNVVLVGDDGVTPHLLNRVVERIDTLRTLGFTRLVLDHEMLPVFSMLNRATPGRTAISADGLERHPSVGGWHGTSLIRAAHLAGMTVSSVAPPAWTSVNNEYPNAAQYGNHAAEMVRWLVSRSNDGERILYVGPSPHLFDDYDIPRRLATAEGIRVDTIVQRGGAVHDGTRLGNEDFYDATSVVGAERLPFVLRHVVGDQPVTLVHAPQIELDGVEAALVTLGQRAVGDRIDFGSKTACEAFAKVDRAVFQRRDPEADGGRNFFVSGVVAMRFGAFEEAAERFARIGDVKGVARALLSAGRRAAAARVLKAQFGGQRVLAERYFQQVASASGPFPLVAGKAQKLADQSEAALRESIPRVGQPAIPSTSDARSLAAARLVAGQEADRGNQADREATEAAPKAVRRIPVLRQGSQGTHGIEPIAHTLPFPSNAPTPGDAGGMDGGMGGALA